MMVRTMPKLTLDETKNYLVAWREHNDKSALESLIISNTGLIIFFVRKYLVKGLSFEELKSAANLGLLNAINKFNYKERAIEGFSTYISISIENAIKTDLIKYNKHKDVISFDQPISHSKDGDELKIEDILGTYSEQLIEDIISEMKIDIVKEALSCLTSRERQIILLRYGLDETHKKTQEEVAKLFGCSKSTILKQEQRAILKMRHPRNTKKLKDFIE